MVIKTREEARTKGGPARKNYPAAKETLMTGRGTRAKGGGVLLDVKQTLQSVLEESRKSSWSQKAWKTQQIIIG